MPFFFFFSEFAAFKMQLSGLNIKIVPLIFRAADLWQLGHGSDLYKGLKKDFILSALAVDLEAWFDLINT